MSINLKFATITMDDGEQYVSAVLINDQYKTIFRKSGSTQMKLIKELKLSQYIGIWRRHKDRIKIGSIATKILDNFKSQVHDLYLNINELEIPKEGEYKDNHIELLRLISLLPDIEHPIVENKPTIKKQSTINLESKGVYDDLPPIIELEDGEVFKDADGNPFQIEMRGERSRLGALYKAKDYQHYCGNDQFVNNLLKEHSSYNKNIDYVILQNHPMVQCTIEGSSKNSNKKQYKINHDMVYLTTAGLIRAVSVSRNVNANIVNLFNWLCDLFYVHKFGSYEERNELAQDLLKTILNDKLSGLYCINLGTFNNLYDTMNICKETYPPEIYSKHNIYKFGLSKDIGARLA